MITYFKHRKVSAFLMVFAIFLAIEVAYFSLKNELAGRLPWGIQIANADYGLLTAGEAEKLLADRIQDFLARPVQFQIDGQIYSYAPADLGLTISAREAVSSATGEIFAVRSLQLATELDLARLRALVLSDSPDLEVSARSARPVLTADGELMIEPETLGRQLDFFALAQVLRQRVSALDQTPVVFRSQLVVPLFTVADLASYEPQLADLARQPLILKDTEYRRFAIDLTDRLAWFDFGTRYLLAGREVILPGHDQLGFLEGEPALTISADIFDDFVTKELDPLVAILPQAVSIARGAEDRVVFDGAGRDGRRVDIVKLRQLILTALESDSREIEIPYLTLRAPVRVSTDLAELGVISLLGGSMTDYAGSPANRQHNILVGAEKLNGRLIAPGEEFSFVDSIGPIDSKAGFKNELVIKEGDVVPELGGGICQVSTTFFRAALTAGLPITAQRPHSLKVHYYSPPGLDATIYPGQVDLKFLNDTGHHVLVQTFVEGTTIRVNLYGASDGRQAKVVGPFYPNGQPITDLSRAGMKMYWQRLLTRPDGSEITERYDSAYSYMPKHD